MKKQIRKNSGIKTKLEFNRLKQKAFEKVWHEDPSSQDRLRGLKDYARSFFDAGSEFEKNFWVRRKKP